MVRMRCRISEDEEPASAREKLGATLSEHLLDADERAFVGPRLAQLLGLEEGGSGDRQDLFAAWRLFFERLADSSPVVLAFEDLQWADSSLLDFIEYLLEWSRDSPLFVITLGRPELQERRPGWGAGQRNFTSLFLEPLSRNAMEALLEGLVPGLPVQLRDQILARAQGVPLYAVETVRMLLDRGLLAQDGPVYKATGEIETLEVPETLHALIAARLDGLSAEERKVLQDGAVLGKTFTLEALGALSPTSELEPLLTGLVRKEVLGVQSDPRSPEHGQYGFLQDLVRHVAYETLARRERKARHLAAAAHLESAFAEPDEVAEVLASHYLSAVEAVPDADDAPAIRAKAGAMLARAGERAGSLGAPEEGQRYYEQAAELADDPAARASLLEQAGGLAIKANRPQDGRARLELAIALYDEAGDQRGAARAGVTLGAADTQEGRLDEAAVRLERAVAEVERDEPGPELAAALAELGRIRVLAGHAEQAGPPLERALTLAERLQLPEVFVEALTSKGLVLLAQGRLEEARILLESAMQRARAEDLSASELRAGNNLAVVIEASDRHADAIALCDRQLTLARRRGDRRWESAIRAGSVSDLIMLARWDEALQVTAEEEPTAGEFARGALLVVVLLHCERGELDQAEAWLGGGESTREGPNFQFRLTFAALEARLLRARGRFGDALAAAERALEIGRGEASLVDSGMKLAVVEGVEAALALPDLDAAERLLAIPETLYPGELTPFLQANAARLRARLEAARGEHKGVDERFRLAENMCREFSLGFYEAVARLEHAEWLAGRGRAEEADGLAAEAEETFEQLKAAPWVERTRRLRAASLSERAAVS